MHSQLSENVTNTHTNTLNMLSLCGPDVVVVVAGAAGNCCYHEDVTVSDGKVNRRVKRGILPT